jgi:hypothetical protein
VALEKAVLAPCLFTVSPELLGEKRIVNELILALDLGVAHQQAIVVKEADGAVFDLQQDLLADGFVGELIPVGIQAALTTTAETAAGSRIDRAR